jgi:hypothetical protein
MNFPKATHFYDLFGGGGSMTHYMMLNKAKKYEHFHYNEIKAHIADTLRRAIAGEFSYEVFKPPWVSREEFHARKEHDGYISCCWSFGNNGDDYLFSEEIEPYKRSMHMAVVFGEFDDLAEKTFKFHRWPAIAKTIKQRRYYLRQIIEHYRKTKIPQHLHQFLNEKQREKLDCIDQLRKLEQLERLERLQQLEQLEHLQQLQQLQQLERLTITSLDYRAVEILPGAVVYCDIPYAGTADYGGIFSHKDFFDWAASRDFPVYISEYNVPDPRFNLVYTLDKRCMLAQDGDANKVKEERLYWNGK